MSSNLILTNFTQKGKIEAIEELSEYPQWILWKEEKRNNDITKIPQQLHGRFAKVNDESTWAKLEKILPNIDWEAGSFDGLGFVFTAEDPFCGIDLDSCRDPKTGEIKDWAEDVLEILNSYTEVSPSGTGVHIICKARLPNWGRNKLKTEKYEIEIYDNNRYFTMTGQVVEDFPREICEAQEGIEKIQDKFWPTGERSENSGLDFVTVDNIKLAQTAEPPNGKKNSLLENSEKFKNSWEHNREDLRDQSPSGYDMSLAAIAAKADWADQEIADLLIAHRRKHGEDLKLRQDYYRRTIEKAKRTAVDLEKAAAIDASCVDDNLRRKILKMVSNKLGIKIKRFVKYTSEPPQYKIETTKGNALLGNGQALLRQRTFRGKLLDATDKVFSHHKKKEFENIIQVLLTAVEKEEIGQETTNEGAVRVWLQSYFQERAFFNWEQEEDRADILQCRNPFYNAFKSDGKAYVFLADFRKWLRINEMEKISIKQLGMMLRAAGCEPRKIHYHRDDASRTTFQAWRTPVEKSDIN